MLVQKLHDATLASLRKNQDGVQDGRNKQRNSAPWFNILIYLRLKCSIYAVNNIKKIILSFDPRGKMADKMAATIILKAIFS